jgi:hypothetical protein
MNKLTRRILLSVLALASVASLGFAILKVMSRPVEAQVIPVDSWGCIKACHGDPVCIQRNCTKGSG